MSINLGHSGYFCSIEAHFSIVRKWGNFGYCIQGKRQYMPLLFSIDRKFLARQQFSHGLNPFFRGLPKGSIHGKKGLVMEKLLSYLKHTKYKNGPSEWIFLWQKIGRNHFRHQNCLKIHIIAEGVNVPIFISTEYSKSLNSFKVTITNVILLKDSFRTTCSRSKCISIIKPWGTLDTFYRFHWVYFDINFFNIVATLGLISLVFDRELCWHSFKNGLFVVVLENIFLNSMKKLKITFQSLFQLGGTVTDQIWCALRATLATAATPMWLAAADPIRRCSS